MAASSTRSPGSHRFVLDYLREEALQSQPHDVRAFLLDTSVLRELTGPLCGAFTGCSNAEQTLDALEADNEYLLEGGVFTPDLISTWIGFKRTNDVLPISLRPTPHEFELYYDI